MDLQLIQQLIIGASLAALLSAMGAFVILRRLSWFSDGMAHVSLGGIAIAAFTSFAPLPVALVWTTAAALIIYFLERKTKLPTDAIIGILFTASLALGILIFEKLGTDHEAIEEALFGGLTTITGGDVIAVLILSALILIWLFSFRRELTLLGLSEELASVSGISVQKQTAALYVALAITTVLGAKVLGVVLVSALLIVPASTSRLITRSFKTYTIAAVIISEIVMLAGVYVASVSALSPGPVTVLIGAGVFILVTIAQAARVVRTR
ncbi:MAG: iron chelate uptake ABC transporter family permease subunit [Patescibacteria group bacterium]